MSKLYTPILVVMLLVAGTALAAPPQPPSGAAAPQAAPRPPRRRCSPTPPQHGRFSILFPGPKRLLGALTLKNGETVTLYEFSADDDNGNAAIS